MSISDVYLITPQKFFDTRGYFVETYSKRPFADIGIHCDFVQDNQSLSTQRGIIRGIHFQAAPHGQAKLVRVLQGSIFDVAVDLRRGSPSFGRWCGATLSADGGEQLFVPFGFGHAFCTLEPQTIVSYKVDGYYAKASEGGLRWDDPDLAIAWPVPGADILVSDKDRELPLLRDFSSPFEI